MSGTRASLQAESSSMRGRSIFPASNHFDDKVIEGL
jgi:hypothetical protein